MSRRLYLFDVDGTLVSTGGAGGKAMAAAFRALWRRENGFAGIEFSGRTDRAILRDAFVGAGLADGAFEHDVLRFKRAYFRRLPASLAATNGTLLPGVRPLLETLNGDAGATVALATGNFRVSAAMKLGHYGIAGFFCGGGFGDRAEGREEMVEQALRSCQRFGRFDTVFVIGDTVHDVRSARAHGAVAVAVATGAGTARALAEAGADLVLDSLMDPPRGLLGA